MRLKNVVVLINHLNVGWSISDKGETWNLLGIPDVGGNYQTASVV
jgi:hypothetical protein